MFLCLSRSTKDTSNYIFIYFLWQHAVNMTQRCTVLYKVGRGLETIRSDCGSDKHAAVVSVSVSSVCIKDESPASSSSSSPKLDWMIKRGMVRLVLN